jgi:hypothetical protein
LNDGHWEVPELRRAEKRSSREVETNLKHGEMRFTQRHCEEERSGDAAIQSARRQARCKMLFDMRPFLVGALRARLDCFVASLLAMTA